MGGRRLMNLWSQPQPAFGRPGGGGMVNFSCTERRTWGLLQVQCAAIQVPDGQGEPAEGVYKLHGLREEQVWAKAAEESQMGHW